MDSIKIIVLQPTQEEIPELLFVNHISYKTFKVNERVSVPSMQLIDTVGHEYYIPMSLDFYRNLMTNVIYKDDSSTVYIKLKYITDDTQLGVKDIQNYNNKHYDDAFDYK